MIGIIALCGVPTNIAQALKLSSDYHILCFGDEPERRGDVKLAYFIKDGASVDLAVVGYPGATGLTACDYLRWQNKQMPILWLCDRAEFEPEAQRIDVDFYNTVLPEAEQAIHTEQTVQIILNAINMKDHKGETR